MGRQIEVQTGTGRTGILGTGLAWGHYGDVRTWGFGCSGHFVSRVAPWMNTFFQTFPPFLKISHGLVRGTVRRVLLAEWLSLCRKIGLVNFGLGFSCEQCPFGHLRYLGEKRQGSSGRGHLD